MQLVASAAAEERAEQRVVVPAGEAQPGEVAARADDHAALAVGEQRVLAQDVRRGRVRRRRAGFGRLGHGPALPAARRRHASAPRVMSWF
jgi:hypothetical protein